MVTDVLGINADRWDQVRRRLATGDARFAWQLAFVDALAPALGHGGVWLVKGGPGSGKSRVVDALVAEHRLRAHPMNDRTMRVYGQTTREQDAPRIHEMFVIEVDDDADGPGLLTPDADNRLPAWAAVEDRIAGVLRWLDPTVLIVAVTTPQLADELAGALAVWAPALRSSRALDFVPPDRQPAVIDADAALTDEAWLAMLRRAWPTGRDWSTEKAAPEADTAWRAHAVADIRDLHGDGAVDVFVSAGDGGAGVELHTVVETFHRQVVAAQGEADARGSGEGANIEEARAMARAAALRLAAALAPPLPSLDQVRGELRQLVEDADEGLVTLDEDGLALTYHGVCRLTHKADLLWKVWWEGHHACDRLVRNADGWVLNVACVGDFEAAPTLVDLFDLIDAVRGWILAGREPSCSCDGSGGALDYKGDPWCEAHGCPWCGTKGVLGGCAGCGQSPCNAQCPGDGSECRTEGCAYDRWVESEGES